MDLSSLVEESLRVPGAAYTGMLEKVTNLLAKEHGQAGNQTIVKHLIKLEPFGEALIIGDLHGDLESLLIILQKSEIVKKMEKNKDSSLIFLGDYGDRGEKSIETYYLILKLKLAFPNQVILLRGNHEAPENLRAEPHDLPFQFQYRFGEKWRDAYDKTKKLWTYLYNAVYVQDRYLMVHGGLSRYISNLQDIAQADENHNEELLEDLLWSDPDEDELGISFSPRGAGCLFGKSITKTVLKKIRANILIRGHEPSANGFKTNHEGVILTLFSRKGSPYFNRCAAYLQLPLYKKFENAKHLIPMITRF